MVFFLGQYMREFATALIDGRIAYVAALLFLEKFATHSGALSDLFQIERVYLSKIFVEDIKSD